MYKWIVLLPLSLQAMNLDLPSPSPSPEPDRVVRSHPIDIAMIARTSTPELSRPLPRESVNPDNITEAMYYIYFRGNGDKIRPTVLPHLKKQVSKTLESPHDPRKEELIRVTHQIRQLKERQRVLGDSSESSSSSSSNLTPAVQDIVSEAITQALEEKERDAKIHERNALSAEQKYKLADKKLTLAVFSNVLTAGCTAAVTAIFTTAVALVIHFTS